MLAKDLPSRGKQSALFQQTNIDALISMAQAYTELGRIDEAKAIYESLINDIAPSYPNSYRNLIKIYQDEGREPTDVEMEVIAQTWSEHCKHRIFGAKIYHTLNGQQEVVDGLVRTLQTSPAAVAGP